MSTRKYTLNHNYFNQIDSPDKAYWLGVIWTDGCLSAWNGRYRIKLTAAEHNQELLESFAKAVETNKPIHVSNTASSKEGDKIYRRAELCLNSKQMYADLISHGIVSRKTYAKYMPVFPERYINHFVRGLFDGDGSIYYVGDKPKVDITGSMATCNWVKERIGRVLGFSGGIHPKSNSKVTFRWRLAAIREVTMFRNWMYEEANCYFSPKYIKFKRY